MKTFFLLLISGLFLLTDIYPRPTFRSYETRSAGLALNFHWMQMNDAFFSPLRYDGPGGELKILSSRNYGNIRRHLSLGAKADYLWNSLDFYALYLQPKLAVGLSWPVAALLTDRSFSYLGGTATATSRMYSFRNEDPDHLYWSTSYTLDFYYLLDVELESGKKVFLELNLPLAGMVSRPSEESHYSFQMPGFGEYMKRLHENIGFATLNRMQALNICLTMDLSRSRRRSVSIGYEMDFARITKPGPVIYFTNSLFIRMFLDVLVYSYGSL